MRMKEAQLEQVPKDRDDDEQSARGRHTTIRLITNYYLILVYVFMAYMIARECLPFNDNLPPVFCRLVEARHE